MIHDRYAGWFEGGAFEGRRVHRVTSAREGRALVALLKSQV
jgi:hypothetical protein